MNLEKVRVKEEKKAGSVVMTLGFWLTLPHLKGVGIVLGSCIPRSCVGRWSSSLPGGSRSRQPRWCDTPCSSSTSCASVAHHTRECRQCPSRFLRALLLCVFAQSGILFLIDGIARALASATRRAALREGDGAPSWKALPAAAALLIDLLV